MMEGVNSPGKIISIAVHFILLVLVDLLVLTSLGRYWLCFFDRTKELLLSIKDHCNTSRYPRPQKGEVNTKELPVFLPHKQHQ